MKNELIEIKNKIINNIIVLSIIFAVPTLLFFIAQLLSGIWMNIYVAQLFYALIIFILFFWRKKLKFIVKSHLLSLAYISIGISSLYYFNFSSVFYICFIPILINGILLGKRYALIYLVLVSILYSIIAIGYTKEYIGVGFDHNYQISDPVTWIVFFTGTLFTLTIILISSSQLYHFFNKSLHEKEIATNKLLDYQDKLETTVKERTEELETANEELQVTNEELYEKNKKIITQNDELEITLQQLNEAQMQLVQSEKMASLGILTAGIAHEINNPLNFIMGGYNGLETFFNESKEKIPEDLSIYLYSIKTGLERTSTIVNSLNQFSRENPSKLEQCNIHDVIDNCLVMLENKTKNKIEIKRNYTNETYNLKIDIGKLHQVILNILTNSVHAINNKGEIRITTKPDNDFLLLDITDNGHGIPKEILPKITDPFFTTKEPGKGTGLGLFITYNFIMEFGGKINFKSTEKKGTSVLISLPLQRISTPQNTKEIQQ